MPRKNIPPMLFAAMLLAAFAIPGISAQEAASFSPSKLARELVRTEIGERSGESAEARAGRIFAAEIDAEKALRLGYTYQETRARLRQTLRLEISAGEEKGKRMASKLAKIERKNSVRQKSKAPGGGIGSGKSSGKGQNGR